MSKKYYHSKESVEEYIKLSEGFDGKRLIDKLKEYLPAGSFVLELGSAEGKDITILQEHGYTITGSDYSIKFLGVLKKKHPNIDLLHLNATILDTELNFDAIYSNKVLHHLTDDELINSFKKQHELLNDNGIICHSFWSGEGDETFKGMYVNYHTVVELTKLLSDSFELLHTETYAEMDKDDSLFIIARKKAI